MTKKILFILIVLPLMVVSCTKDEEPGPGTNNPAQGTCDTSDVSYGSFVKPTLVANCATSGCHTGANPANGFDFNLYAVAKSTSDSGVLFGAISHASGFKPMPRGGSKLEDCTIDKIKSWIDAGALDN